jgi:imidazolonepropionase-like amidohydrolase
MSVWSPLGASLLCLLLCQAVLNGQQGAASWHGKRPARTVIRGALVIEGNGTPAAGPKDIVIDGNRIAAIVSVSPEAATKGDLKNRPQADVEIDARGKYVLPGFVNLHAHLQDERAGRAMPVEYCTKLWLASGITAIRDVGSNWEKAKLWRERSASGELAAPRIFLYRGLTATDPAAAASLVRRYKEEGADGLKLFGLYRDVFRSIAEAADAAGLRRAHHAGVEETNAWDDIELKTSTIEHWYGIPDAALADRVQGFPPSYNYSNELDRFRWAGRLWREAGAARLEKVLEGMVRANVAWDPTLSIYEASRDLEKAQNQPYFRDYLHPSLAAFFEPNLANHGSYFTNWTTEDEVYWKENYRIWMAAVKRFAELGGLVTAGEDAGFIYRVYGFGYSRELELHQEAGFAPLKVIQHATSNGALALGKENELGRVRTGWLADLIVVNGNPLENLKRLAIHHGGIEWTIKDGILYHAPRLAREVRELVAEARGK